jgi:diguanylate cyclase
MNHQPMRRSGMLNREPKYTLKIAQLAIEQIAKLKLPADPNSFAVWYVYCSAQVPELNRDVNALVAAKSTPTIEELDQIFEQYLSPMGALACVSKIGGEIAREAEQIADRLETSVEDTATFHRRLEDACHELDPSANRDALRAVLIAMMRAAEDMDLRSKTLETALRSSKQTIENLQDEIQAIRQDSLRDSLTSLANRKHFDLKLRQAVATAGTSKVDPLSVLMIDIDHFKQFNDSYGHHIGDEVLRLVGNFLLGSVKGKDFPARYGGEEFAVLLPNTDLDRARLLAENIRAGIALKVLRKQSTGEQIGRITISIGVAELQPGEAPASLIERADEALYSAKRSGRNLVHSGTAP